MLHAMRLKHLPAITFLHASGAAAFLMAATAVHAGLEFETPDLKVDAGHAEVSAPGIFKFKVTGDRAVTITDIQTTCSCLKAASKDDKKTFQPGESGQIETAFQLGTAEGEVAKRLTIHTDDPAHAEIPLSLTVNVKPLFSIEPNHVIWAVGDKAEGKTIRVKMLGEDPVKITSTQSTRDNITVEVKAVKEGREYEVIVTPKDTSAPMLGALTLITDCKFERYQRRMVFFNVQRRKAEPAAPAPAR